LESSSFDINTHNENLADDFSGKILLSDSGKTSETFKVNLHGKWVVLKRIKKEFVENPVVEKLFDKEFETGFGLDHPHIVKYINKGSDKEGKYILTEFIDGKSLREHFQNGASFSEKNILKIVTQLLQAVSYLHKKNIFHLDIKPENIIVSDKTGNIKLIDFGFSYSDGRIPFSSGTKKYCSADQISNPEKINYKNDLYSIGVVITELLTGTTELNHVDKLPAKFRKTVKRFIAINSENEVSIDDELERLTQKKSSPLVYVLVVAISIGIIYLLIPNQNTEKETIINNNNPKPTKWSALPQLPKGRSDGGLVQYEGRIFYLSGIGADGGLPTYDVYEFNSSTNQYSEKRKIGTARAEMGAVLLDGRIYTFGGWIGNAATDTSEVYDIAKDEWEYLQPLPKKLTSVSACAWKDKIFILGSTLDVTNTYFYEFNPSTKTYSQKTVFNNSRMNACLVSVNNLIYAIGGNSYKNDSYYVHNDCDVYNPMTDQWERKSSLPVGITRGSAVVTGDEIHYLGGTSRANSVTDADALNSHYIYDTRIDSWKNGNELPIKAWGIECVALNNKIYCFGGYINLPNATGKASVLEIGPKH